MGWIEGLEADRKDIESEAAAEAAPRVWSEIEPGDTIEGPLDKADRELLEAIDQVERGQTLLSLSILTNIVALLGVLA